MSSKVCPFCGSKERMLKTPYVTRTLGGGSEPEYTYCCKAQAANHTWYDKRFNPVDGEPPSLESLEKL